jgi:hypothetical protein
MEKKNTITVTKIEYQLIEVYNQIEVSIDELESLIDLTEEDEISSELHDILYDSDNIIYYAPTGDDGDYYDCNRSLKPFKIPFIEHSLYMGSILIVGDSCVSYDMDDRIITGNKKNEIHDFSELKSDTLSSYVKTKRRTNVINDIINP